MRHTRQPFLTAALWLLLMCAPPVLAGPLDRTDTGPQVNPATNDMLRVPGVVGMDQQSALDALQQAGLNPRIHTVRHTEKRYAGQEGMVVTQMPAAGGMAMLGSSVSITVYEPGGVAPPDQSAPPADQNGSSGDQYGDDGGTTSAAPNPPADSGDGAGNGGVSDNGAAPPVQLPSGSGWRPPVIHRPVVPSTAPPVTPTAPVTPPIKAPTSPPSSAPPPVTKAPGVKPSPAKPIVSPVEVPVTPVSRLPQPSGPAPVIRKPSVEPPVPVIPKTPVVAPPPAPRQPLPGKRLPESRSGTPVPVPIPHQGTPNRTVEPLRPAAPAGGWHLPASAPAASTPVPAAPVKPEGRKVLLGPHQDGL